MTPDAQLASTFSRFSTPDNRRFFEALCRHLAPLTGDPCVSMYFEFAITTNARGRAVAALIKPHQALRGANYLDIGCAYGGFLVAFAEQGAQVTGIDIDPTLLELARHNLADHGVEAPLLLGDATSLVALSEFRSSVDVATCNDVIEHVADPRALVETIAQLLAPGGVCYLEIPNALLPRYVLSDGHFQLFGITLLAPDEATRYWNERHPDQPYQVVQYFRLEDYERMFREAGLSMRVLPETLAGVSAQTLKAQRDLLLMMSPEAMGTVPTGVRDLVADKLSAYHAAFDAFPRDDDDDERLLLTYGTSFWKVLVTKR
jgi:2-polyprenyl-3-methyl-5-hydroxy-6-metoxy-1,4-benzoquinol methylase